MSAKAIGYLRVSSLGQVEGDGLARQREAIERFARASGFEIVEWFEDGGVSGATELENRPALLDALARIAGNGVTTMIVEHSDRLARDLYVQEAIIKAFADAGARVLTADGLDLTADDDSRRFIRQVMGAANEFAKRSLVRRMKAARDKRRAERGWCEGRAPFYGHNEQEKKIVHRMKRLRKSGKGYKAVANALNAEGATTRTGRQWTSRAVYKVLARWRTVEKFAQPASAIKVLKP